MLPKLEFVTQLLWAFVVLVVPLIRLVLLVPLRPGLKPRSHPTSATKAVLRPDKLLAKCLILLLLCDRVMSAMIWCG